MAKEYNRCFEFLELNGWIREETPPGEHFVTYNKSGFVSIDLSGTEIVLIADEGDFLHLPCNYFALVGALICYHQLSFNFNRVQKKLP